MIILTETQPVVNHQFQVGTPVVVKHGPRQHTFVQSSRVVARWDQDINPVATVSRITSVCGSIFLRVTPAPEAGFGEFAFYPHELRTVHEVL